MNIFESKITLTNTVCYNEVAIDSNIFKLYISASYYNRAFLYYCIIFTFGAYVHLEHIMEELCEFFSCDIVQRSDCSVFITIDITFSNHTRNSLYRPCINLIFIRELIEYGCIIAIYEKYSCKSKDYVFSLHECIGIKGSIACTIHDTHLYNLCNGVSIPLSFLDILEI